MGGKNQYSKLRNNQITMLESEGLKKDLKKRGGKYNGRGF